MAKFPVTIRLPSLRLTVNGVVFHESHSSRESGRGESVLVFDCTDDLQRTGHIRWDYRWDGRDVMNDEVSTDQPAWVDALRDAGEFPTAYFTPGDKDIPQTSDIRPPKCDHACRIGS